MSQERDALENLLKSDGWLILCRWAEEEWNAQLATHLRSAANDGNDLLALQKIRQVIAAKDAVHRFIARPKERLTQLARLTEQEQTRKAYSDLIAWDEAKHTRRGPA